MSRSRNRKPRIEYQRLVQCSEVCKSWSPMALSALYRRVILHKAEQIHVLQRTLRDRSDLGRHNQILEIRTNVLSSITSSNVTMRSILGHTPNLKWYRILLHYSFGDNAPYSGFLPTKLNSQLSRPSIAGDFIDTRGRVFLPDAQMSMQVPLCAKDMQHLPGSIERLDLRGLDVQALTPLPLPNLQSLCVDEPTLKTAPLDWLVPTPTLHHIHIWNVSDQEVCKKVFGPILDQIKSMNIHAYPGLRFRARHYEATFITESFGEIVKITFNWRPFSEAIARASTGTRSIKPS